MIATQWQGLIYLWLPHKILIRQTWNIKNAKYVHTTLFFAKEALWNWWNVNVGIFDGSPSCKIISIMEVTAWNVFFRHLKKGGYLLTYIHTPAKKYHWQWHHVLFEIEWGGYGIVHNGWRLKSKKYFFL